MDGKVDECSYLPLRNALVHSEDDYLASCLAVTLAKLAIKSKKRLCLAYKSQSIDGILIMSSMLRERQNKNDFKRMRKLDKDSYQRI